MSRIPLHSLDSAPPASRSALEALAQRSPSGQPINLHAQMAHAPAVLLGYMAMRKALDEHGTLDRQIRTAILVAVAAADECAYSVAVNTLVAQQSGWPADQVPALRNADATDPKLAALLRLARRAVLDHGQVDEPTWQAARAAGWGGGQLPQTLPPIGPTPYFDT